MNFDCPFPGMDPYLETPAYWPDFHNAVIYELRRLLIETLPEAYDARIDEQVSLIELPPEHIQQFKPDLSVVRGVGPRDGQTAVAQVESGDQPVTLPIDYLDTETEAFIQILHRKTKELITIIEVLSPSNKNHPGLMDYCSKREAILRQQIHLVELDFLVRGRRFPTAKPLPTGDYYAFVSRWEQRPNCEVYASDVRRALPTIRIPLRAPDADIAIRLQDVFAETYRIGRYRNVLDYHLPPAAPLAPADAAWAAELGASVCKD